MPQAASALEEDVTCFCGPHCAGNAFKFNTCIATVDGLTALWVHMATLQSARVREHYELQG